MISFVLVLFEISVSIVELSCLSISSAETVMPLYSPRVTYPLRSSSYLTVFAQLHAAKHANAATPSRAAALAVFLILKFIRFCSFTKKFFGMPRQARLEIRRRQSQATKSSGKSPIIIIITVKSPSDIFFLSFLSTAICLP